MLSGLLMLVVGVFAPAEPQESPQEVTPIRTVPIEVSRLKKWAGDWDTRDRFRPMASAAYQESAGQHLMRLEMNEWWLVSDLQAVFAGVSYKAHLQLGWDPRKKVYVGTIINNLTPDLVTMEGTFDEKTNVLSMTYLQIDPRTQEAIPQRSEWQMLSETEAVLRIFSKPKDSPEWLMLEKQYKRR